MELIVIDPFITRPIFSNRLMKMEIVSRVYKVKFIINISELGEDDSLALNASKVFSSMNVPWYTTAASKDQEGPCFLEQIDINNREILTIIGVNTESLQRSASGFGNNQSNWLSKTLEAAVGNWLIVVGHHPVVVCEENGEQIKSKHVYEQLHRIFVKYGVNAYLSGQGCSNISDANALEDGVAYIGNGSPYPIKSEPYLASLSKRSAFQKKTDVGFLLHRVSSSEFTTYFMSLSGEVLDKIVIRAKGTEVM
ncbi:uncharacterized protein [Euphorbia lathyris]|uniref:uncharacterized protein isoform X2 n=1 Tax=Euphorbia lathyris TaxID=212925 RepID=UPI0033139C73